MSHVNFGSTLKHFDVFYANFGNQSFAVFVGARHSSVCKFFILMFNAFKLLLHGTIPSADCLTNGEIVTYC